MLYGVCVCCMVFMCVVWCLYDVCVCMCVHLDDVHVCVCVCLTTPTGRSPLH